MKRYFITILFMLLFSSVSISQDFFYDDFEYDSFAQINNKYDNDFPDNRFIWGTLHADPDINIAGDLSTINGYHFKKTEIIKYPTSSDNKIIRFELNKVKNNDCCSEDCCYDDYKGTKWRNHLNRNEFSTLQRRAFQPNTEYWMGWRFYLPSDYEMNNTSNNPDVVGQLHLISGLSDETLKLPPLALMIYNGKYYLRIQTKDSDNFHDQYSYCLGAVEKNKWVDWKFNFVLSDESESGENGYVKVWKNGQLMHGASDYTGKTVAADYPFYMKIGLYKPAWWNDSRDMTGTDKKVIYYDNTWFGKSDLSNTEQQKLSLIQSDCGNMMDGADMTLSSYRVSNDNKYKFRFCEQGTDCDANTDELFWVDSKNHTINLSHEDRLKPNSTYNVKVMVPGHSNFDGYSPTACEVSTDELALSLIEEDCGKTLTDSDMTLSANNDIKDTYDYKYRFCQQGTGCDEPGKDELFWITTSKSTIDLSNEDRLKANVTYNVKISAPGHPHFDQYSATPCEVSTSSLSTNSRLSRPKDKQNASETGQIAYPNPTNGIIHFNSRLLSSSVQVKVQTLGGQKLITEQLSAHETLNISGLQAGMYVLSVWDQENNQHYLQKIIKK